MSIQVIAYLRVSTAEQGKSGLGLEAQRASIEAFASREGLAVAAWHVETQSGKTVSDTLAERPQLAAALESARIAGAKVIVSKLDRLSRDVHFISGLMRDKVPFIVCDLGSSVDNFMLHIYAALAEKERTMIRQRTIDALARAQARGVKLGSGNPRAGGIASAKAAVELRAKHQAALATVGVGGDEVDIAARLNAAGYRTSHNKPWNVHSVKRLLGSDRETLKENLKL